MFKLICGFCLIRTVFTDVPLLNNVLQSQNGFIPQPSPNIMPPISVPVLPNEAIKTVPSTVEVPMAKEIKLSSCENSYTLLKILTDLLSILTESLNNEALNIRIVNDVLDLVNKYLEQSPNVLQNPELSRNFAFIQNQLSNAKNQLHSANEENRFELPSPYNVPANLSSTPTSILRSCKEAFKRLIDTAQNAYNNLSNQNECVHQVPSQNLMNPEPSPQPPLMLNNQAPSADLLNYLQNQQGKPGNMLTVLQNYRPDINANSGTEMIPPYHEQPTESTPKVANLLQPTIPFLKKLNILNHLPYTTVEGDLTINLNHATNATKMFAPPNNSNNLTVQQMLPVQDTSNGPGKQFLYQEKLTVSPNSYPQHLVSLPLSQPRNLQNQPPLVQSLPEPQINIVTQLPEVPLYQPYSSQSSNTQYLNNLYPTLQYSIPNKPANHNPYDLQPNSPPKLQIQPGFQYNLPSTHKTPAQRPFIRAFTNNINPNASPLGTNPDFSSILSPRKYELFNNGNLANTNTPPSYNNLINHPGKMVFERDISGVLPETLSTQPKQSLYNPYQLDPYQTHWSQTPYLNVQNISQTNSVPTMAPHSQQNQPDQRLYQPNPLDPLSQLINANAPQIQVSGTMQQPVLSMPFGTPKPNVQFTVNGFLPQNISKQNPFNYPTLSNYNSLLNPPPVPNLVANYPHLPSKLDLKYNSPLNPPPVPNLVANYPHLPSKLDLKFNLNIPNYSPEPVNSPNQSNYQNPINQLLLLNPYLNQRPRDVVNYTPVGATSGPDQSPTVANVMKLNNPHGLDTVELTFLLQPPVPVTLYYVKYKLPFATFRDILVKKSGSDRSGLYQELASKSEIEISRQLLNIPKEQIANLVSTNGTIVDAKLVNEAVDSVVPHTPVQENPIKSPFLRSGIVNETVPLGTTEPITGTPLPLPTQPTPLTQINHTTPLTTLMPDANPTNDANNASATLPTKLKADDNVLRKLVKEIQELNSKLQLDGIVDHPDLTRRGVNTDDQSASDSNASPNPTRTEDSILYTTEIFVNDNLLGSTPSPVTSSAASSF